MCPDLEDIHRKDYSEFLEKSKIDKDLLCETIFKCSKNKFSKPNATRQFLDYIKMQQVFAGTRT